MATVEFESVRKVYPGDVEAIKGVDIQITDGEFIVIVGPSGCGKSTLLRMVAGLETINSGSIRIDSKIVNHLEPGERDIAMVFQNYALYPHMSVFENMAYGLKNQGVPREEIRQRVTEVSSILELNELLHRKPRALSGGQRQRVAMGRAIVRKPKAFLFDEPLSNLDAKLRVQMRLEIKSLQRKLGTTSIYVTHDQVEAMTLADRLIVMNAGVAEQIGTPMEVYEKPATTFVASFIGSPSMNFLNAAISDNLTSLQIEGGYNVNLDKKPARLGHQRQVILGIRPEHIQISESQHNTNPFEVGMVETLGADSLIYGKIQGEDELITIRVPGRFEPKREVILNLVLNPQSFHLFERESGKRIH